MVTRLGKTPAQLFALVFGIVYLAIGLIGFGVTGFDNWIAKETSEKLLIFPVNPLHNLVHIGIGAIWMISSATHKAAARVTTLIGIVYGAVAALGFLGILDFLAISSSGSADNWLHLATAILALYFGTVGALGPRAKPAT